MGGVERGGEYPVAEHHENLLSLASGHFVRESFKTMSTTTKPIPDGYHSITPLLCVRSAAEASEFYQRAFGAREMFRVPLPNGKIMHAELRIGDSVVMLADEMPERGAVSAQSVGASPTALRIYVADVDQAFAQAIAAGATQTMPVATQFWGDRIGQVRDPFGYLWLLATHVEDVSPAEYPGKIAAMMKPKQ